MTNDLIVMTWNVENLFRSDDTDADATYTAKLTYLAGLIAGTGADIVALQEIGTPSSHPRGALAGSGVHSPGQPWRPRPCPRPASPHRGSAARRAASGRPASGP
ncbi:endonuclease/exonuclease/phosphatase family protein [Micromonospora sp. WMMD723]|uniref:endonuclease/exonuclease/phosphatase family protein n=1 Tax=Micromonospora sp. WMMD723 TaxID=3403465 RepID=UPI003CF4490D